MIFVGFLFVDSEWQRELPVSQPESLPPDIQFVVVNPNPDESVLNGKAPIVRHGIIIDDSRTLVVNLLQIEDRVLKRGSQRFVSHDQIRVLQVPHRLGQFDLMIGVGVVISGVKLVQGLIEGLFEGEKPVHAVAFNGHGDFAAPELVAVFGKAHRFVRLDPFTRLSVFQSNWSKQARRIDFE